MKVCQALSLSANSERQIPVWGTFEFKSIAFVVSVCYILEVTKEYFLPEKESLSQSFSLTHISIFSWQYREMRLRQITFPSGAKYSGWYVSKGSLRDTANVLQWRDIFCKQRSYLLSAFVCFLLRICVNARKRCIKIVKIR